MTKEQLLDIVFKEHKQSPFLSHREFECMVALVEDGTINTVDELQKFGFGVKEEHGDSSQNKIQEMLNVLMDTGMNKTLLN